MRPSIMSLGATMSAPAWACETAVRASSSSVWSLSTTYPSCRPRLRHAAVPVVGVLAQAQVGDHDQLGVRLLDRAGGELDDAVIVVIGAGALGVLVRGDPEQDHGGDAERGGAARLGHRLGDREPVDPRHRPDRLASLDALGHEQRVHEVGRGELRLAHEPAQLVRGPQPAHAGLVERPSTPPRIRPLAGLPKPLPSFQGSTVRSTTSPAAT